MTRSADWYFDFVSPYSYLARRLFPRLPADLQIRNVPVLFAGLLKHFGHMGPAEIPLKRAHAFRFCRWFAKRHAIPFVMPPAHPFNPLEPLRECIRLGSSDEVVDALFRGIFEQGMLPTDDRYWQWCAAESGCDITRRDDYDAAIKDTLRENTARAAEAGIYGVPTFAFEGETFWGADHFDMFLEYLEDPAPFMDDEARRIADLPVGATRRR